MVLTDKDLINKKPVVKKPKTLNPLGGIIIGASLGYGQVLIYNSFIDSSIDVGFSVLGIFLVILASAVLLATLSLTGKFVSFMVKLEGEKKKSVQTALQIMYFYIGFIPIYGFITVYSYGASLVEEDFTRSGTLDFWKIMVVMGVIILFFVAELFYSISLFYKKEISFGELREPFFQPSLMIMIIISILTTAIATILFVFM